MMTLITCPTCHHKFTTPEAAMGERHTCPNCQSLFLAGKSVAETDGRMASLKLNIDKTILGETDPPIRYNCPRCKKPLESPASEAGTKKPCPACGGRLQVPASPALQPSLSKTLLACAESDSLPVQQPAVAAQAPIPAAPSVAPSQPMAGSDQKGKTGLWPLTGNARTYAIGGIVAAAILLAVLLLHGSISYNAELEKSMAAQNQEHEKSMAAYKQELDKLKADLGQKQDQLKQQELFEAERRRLAEQLMAKQEARQRELDLERDLDRKNLAFLKDQKLAEEAKAKLEQKQRELDEEKRAAKDQRDKSELEVRLRLEALQKQIEANQKATTIITPPPPPVYHPPPPPWYRWPYYPF